MTRIERRNRAVFTAVCLLMLVGGAAALARSYGAFGDKHAAMPLYDETLDTFVSKHQSWFWPSVAAAGLVLAYLGWRWFRSQFRSWNTLESTDFVACDSLGSTRIATDALCAAVERDLEKYPGISEAVAEIRSAVPPRVDLFLTMHDDADVVAVRERIDGQALPRLCTTLSVQSVLPVVRMRLVQPEIFAN